MGKKEWFGLGVNRPVKGLGQQKRSDPVCSEEALFLFLLAQDDGTDTEFRNVGLYTSDAGEITKRILTTYRTRRKLENYHTKYFTNET